MSIERITVRQMQELQQKEEIVLIDCREQEEWDSGHIPKALLCPLSNFEEHLEKLLPYKDKTVIVQCRSGQRSFRACLFLESQGFSNLKNLEGGILDWADHGLPVIISDSENK